MTENMKRFMERISDEPEVRERLTDIEDEQALREAAIAEAGKLGIALTEEDFTGEDDVLMSDDELECVAGGNACVCPVAGGGTGGGKKWEWCNPGGRTYTSKTCACILGGGGLGSDGEKTCMRCYCILTGEGYDRRKEGGPKFDFTAGGK